MTQLKRLLEALPSYRSSCELLCRMKLVSVVEFPSRVRSGHSFALLAPHIPSTSVKRFSTPHATISTRPRHDAPKMEREDIIYAAGQPADLPDRVLNLPSTWDLTASKKGITRIFIFSSFSKAWRFMTAVAGECMRTNHHPSWSNLYNQVTVEWTTHKPEGLSIKDVEMAEFCDRTADDIGLKK